MVFCELLRLREFSEVRYAARSVDSTLRSMNAPTGTTLTERAEWVLEIGEPKPPSRKGLAVLAPLGVLFVGVLLLHMLVGEWNGSRSLFMVASALLWMYLLSEKVGSFLYAHREVPWGRGLRALGYAAFFPLSMVFYLVYWWSTSTLMFGVLLGFMGSGIVWVALRLVRLARGRE